MMKFGIIVWLALFVLCGCQSDAIDLEQEEDFSDEVGVPPQVVKGMIRVKLYPDVGEAITSTRSSSGTLSVGYSAMDDYLKKIGAREMRRVFPYSGKYEARSRAEGMHLWYDIWFDESRPVSRTAADARNIAGVEIVETLVKPTLPTTRAYPVLDLGSRSSSAPFNDPRLPAQWHYNNPGTISKSEAGADANIFKAWKKETGKSNVIVAVIDGGIDVTHEDLEDNLWINRDEMYGLAGEDDDNNGYDDDKYGFNFITRSGKIDVDAEGHGTHVAGTIGARNNNGIGVAGIAGGDGRYGSGVRLMSCQVFRYAGESANEAEAIKYAADNGAVIAQNSWGWVYPGEDKLPLSLKSAIDYFIKYAGCDPKTGRQSLNSPMKGGVVFFAAGNDGKDYVSYPGAYEEVIAVSAMSPSFEKSYYTNRGDWVDIMAPGGDRNYGEAGLVLSTFPMKPYSSSTPAKYGYLQGTSMACPHVAGIAALVVSKFGGQGFTNEDLKKRILTSVLPVKIDEKNPGFEGRLGVGYIDGEKALAENEGKNPEKLADISVEASFDSFGFEWNAVADEDDGTAACYRFYFSTKEALSPDTYKNADYIDVNGVSYLAGDRIFYRMKNLAIATRFYFAVVAEDRWGLSSAPLFFEAETKVNRSPVIKRGDSKAVRVAGDQEVAILFSVEEPDGQDWTYKLSGQQQGVSVTKVDNGLEVRVRAQAPIGKHVLTLSVYDPFEVSASIELPFEVYENQAPKQIKPLDDVYLPVGRNGYKLDMEEYFKDEDGHDISFDATSFNSDVAQVTMAGSILTINPLKLGKVVVQVGASDFFGSKTLVNMQLHVVKDELVYMVYPIPATKVLHLRFSDEVNSAEVIIFSSIGQKVLRQHVSVVNRELVDIDVSKLAGGNYVLNVEANGKRFQKAFVKH